MPKSEISSVLIVEDDPASRIALSRLLKDLGFRTSASANLADARRAITESLPDILILDLMLPDGSGTDLLADIRRKKSPIIVAVVTAATDEVRLHEVTALGPDALFGKPVDIKDFEDWLIESRDGRKSPADAGTSPSEPHAVHRLETGKSPRAVTTFHA